MEMKTKSRRPFFSNRVWQVYLDHIETEDGDIPDYLVVAPKNAAADLVGGVTVLPVMGDEILLIRQWRQATRTWGWEAARGFLDPGENKETSALRELEEEAGVTTTPDKLIPLGLAAPEGSTIAGYSAIFAALDCRPGGQRDLKAEPGLGEVKSFSQSEVKRMARDSEILDAMTLIALYRYWAGPIEG